MLLFKQFFEVDFQAFCSGISPCHATENSNCSWRHAVFARVDVLIHEVIIDEISLTCQAFKAVIQHVPIFVADIRRIETG